MKLSSKTRFALGGAVATSVCILSSSSASAAATTGWRDLGGCAVAVTSSWALGGCPGGLDHVYVDVHNSVTNADAWVWQTGVADAITQDSNGFAWAVGTQPNGVYFGYSTLDGGFGGLKWTALPNTPYGGGIAINFATVAAGWPEVGTNPAIGQGFNGIGGPYQVWATDTNATGRVWAWSGEVLFTSSYSIGNSSWIQINPVPNGAAKVAMQTESFPPGSVCTISIPWAMDTLGNVYQYSLTQGTPATQTTPACKPPQNATCTEGCWIDMGITAKDISSGDYVLGQDGIIYQWSQGSFAALAEQPPLSDAGVPLPDGGVEPVALLAIGAPTYAGGPLSAIDNTGEQVNGVPTAGAVWANW